MAQALTKNKARTLGGGGFIVKGTMVPSGNYVTDGEVPTPSFASFNPTNREPDLVAIVGKAGFLYQYDNANKKILVRGQEPTSATAGVIAFSQIAAAAYPAGVTGDVIEWVAIYLPF